MKCTPLEFEYKKKKKNGRLLFSIFHLFLLNANCIFEMKFIPIFKFTFELSSIYLKFIYI